MNWVDVYFAAETNKAVRDYKNFCIFWHHGGVGQFQTANAAWVCIQESQRIYEERSNELKTDQDF